MVVKLTLNIILIFVDKGPNLELAEIANGESFV